MNPPKTEKNSNPFWNFFCSVRLTIVLLVVLAVASILGTLIPQQESAVDFAGSLSAGTFRLFTSLDLFDLYHSLWFRLILALLTLNLVICSIDRFPNTWRRFRAKTSADRDRPFDHLPSSRILEVKETPDQVSDKVSGKVEKRYRNTTHKETPSGHFYLAEKGRHSHFGVYLVHLSVLLIIIGGLVGSFFGFEAYVNIVEGETIDTVRIRNSSRSLELGFKVRCDDFMVDFYENGAPKEYRSDLTFLVDGQEMAKTKLRVNHPAKFMGVTFYQSSYGSIPGQTVRLRIVKHASGVQSTTVMAKAGSVLPLPHSEAQFQLADVRADFMGMGPAALITVLPEKGDKVSFWIFQQREMILKRFPEIFERFPKLNPSAFKPYSFFMDNIETKYYTGLQVNRNPGVPTVWAGFSLMVAGFFVTFFTSHRRLWVRVSRSPRGSTISVAGSSSKNPVGLERELEDLTDQLRDLFSKRE